jgi:hypothetical protein
MEMHYLFDSPRIECLSEIENNSELQAQLKTVVDLVLVFRPCWGSLREDFLKVSNELIGPDIKTLAVDQFSTVPVHWRPHLNLLMEIVK